MIDPYVILAMPLHFILSSNLSFVLSKYQVFIMAMPLDFSYVCHTMHIAVLSKVYPRAVRVKGSTCNDCVCYVINFVNSSIWLIL